MTIIGTLDLDPATYDPAKRRAGFSRSPAPDQYLVTLRNATHGVFDDKSPWLVDRLSYPRHHVYVELVTTALFNAYLKRDGEAQDCLLDGAIEQTSDRACELEHKHVTPLDKGLCDKPR